jgi:phosphotransacetylase
MPWPATTLRALRVMLAASRFGITRSQGISVGPILLGATAPVHILTHTTTVRGIVNMTAVTAV